MLVSAKKARKLGYTNHARFYGIPCYVKFVTDENGEIGFDMLAKCILLEPVIDLFAWLVVTVNIVNQDDGLFSVEIGAAL